MFTLWNYKWYHCKKVYNAPDLTNNYTIVSELKRKRANFTQAMSAVLCSVADSNIALWLTLAALAEAWHPLNRPAVSLWRERSENERVINNHLRHATHSCVLAKAAQATERGKCERHYVYLKYSPISCSGQLSNWNYGAKRSEKLRRLNPSASIGVFAESKQVVSVIYSASLSGFAKYICFVAFFIFVNCINLICHRQISRHLLIFRTYSGSW